VNLKMKGTLLVICGLMAVAMSLPTKLNTEGEIEKLPEPVQANHDLEKRDAEPVEEVNGELEEIMKEHFVEKRDADPMMESLAKEAMDAMADDAYNAVRMEESLHSVEKRSADEEPVNDLEVQEMEEIMKHSVEKRETGDEAEEAKSNEEVVKEMDELMAHSMEKRSAEEQEAVDAVERVNQEETEEMDENAEEDDDEDDEPLEEEEHAVEKRDAADEEEEVREEEEPRPCAGGNC